MAVLPYSIEDPFGAEEDELFGAGSPRPALALLPSEVNDLDLLALSYSQSAEPVYPTPVFLAGAGAEFGGGVDAGTPPQYIAGRVLDIDGYPVPRTVIAIDRATGQRMGITTSGLDGTFVLRPQSLDPVILIAVPLDGEQLNAVVLDNIQPIPE